MMTMIAVALLQVTSVSLAIFAARRFRDPGPAYLLGNVIGLSLLALGGAGVIFGSSFLLLAQ
ncbi:hypothetical protein [Jannaschia rubra]|uniref:Uncharacterized protein n=1 Tax=Jannaschia rubra TaxID=282197 RepID=A0A0M6XR73_9RHOB|nr:hypothetical protein [Jannaschia rubra]CTQ33570.1 hypothetical protein JAN5088_02352 [Jannaschia rubra]SFG04083.1 hypothetical protein SAMN04488517_102399 [Jannaschia rubra]